MRWRFLARPRCAPRKLAVCTGFSNGVSRNGAPCTSRSDAVPRNTRVCTACRGSMPRKDAVCTAFWDRAPFVLVQRTAFSSARASGLVQRAAFLGAPSLGLVQRASFLGTPSLGLVQETPFLGGPCFKVVQETPFLGTRPAPPRCCPVPSPSRRLSRRLPLGHVMSLRPVPLIQSVTINSRAPSGAHPRERHAMKNEKNLAPTACVGCLSVSSHPSEVPSWRA